MSGEEAGRAVENNRKSKHQKKTGIGEYWGLKMQGWKQNAKK